MHIRLLLLTFFLQFFPDLVNHGHLYILDTPLFRVRNKKETSYCYSEDEKLKAMAEALKTVEKTKGNQIIARIFGAEAQAGAKLMLREYGKGNEVFKTQTELLKSASSATEMYSKMTDDLQGDLAKLASVIQDKILTVFTAFEKAFRDLAKSAASSVEQLKP